MGLLSNRIKSAQLNKSAGAQRSAVLL